MQRHSSQMLPVESVRTDVDRCTPAILAYSASYCNSIYYSKLFQSLSHAYPAERQSCRLLADTVRCEDCVNVAESVEKMRKNIHLCTSVNLQERVQSQGSLGGGVHD